MAEYEFVLTDFDGVIAKSLDPWFESLQLAKKEFGLELDREQERLVMSDLKNLLKFGLSEGNLIPFTTRTMNLARQAVKESPLYDGAEKLLLDLTIAGKKLGVVSSSLELRAYLAHKQLTWYFGQSIVSGQDVKNKKPHPEGLLKALSLLRGTKERAIAIGDSATDLEAANRAGIDSVLFHTREHLRFHNRDELMAQKPKYVVSSHAELGNILLKSKNGRQLSPKMRNT